MPNHHYIPQFFLDGFTDSDGQFYVYDKERDVIKTKRFYPKSHFFEENRNSITVNGKLDDSPEDAYGISENTDKHIIKYIQRCKGVLNLNTDELLRLQLFLHTLLFRLPIMDDIYMRFMKTVDYRLLGLSIKDNDGPLSDDRINEIKTDDKFIQMYRPSLGVILFTKFQSHLDHHNWKIAYNPNENNLFSDNPFVFEDLNTIDFFENQFVLPVTKRYKLIRTKSPLVANKLNAQWSLLSEILIIHQAKKFVCSSSKKHLENMVNASKLYRNETARTMLFAEIPEQG